MNKIFKLAHLY